MKTIVVYGHSDDLIYFRNIDSAEAESETRQNALRKDRKGRHVGEFDADTITFNTIPDYTKFLVCGEFFVHAFYSLDGIWCFAVSRIEEDDSYPNYPIRVTAHKNGYSMQLEIDVPPDKKVHVKQLKP